MTALGLPGNAPWPRSRPRPARTATARHGRRLAHAGRLAAAVLIVLLVALPTTAIFGIDPGQIAGDIFKAIITFIVGDIDKLGRKIVRGLVGLPLYGSGNKDYAGLARYQGYMQAAAWGVIPLMFLIAGFRYWMASIATGSAYEALQTLWRTAIAIAGLLMWVPAFDLVTRIFNEFAAAVLNGPGVGKGMTDILSAGLSTDPISGGGFAMIAVLGALFAVVVLMLVKIVISALLAILFVLGPVAIALWPVEDVSWMARSVLQGLFALLVWPTLWALCFAVFGILGTGAFDGLFALGKGERPLVALAALVCAWKLPTIVARQALLAGLLPGVRLRAGIPTPSRALGAASGGGAAAGGAGAASSAGRSAPTPTPGGGGA